MWKVAKQVLKMPLKLSPHWKRKHTLWLWILPWWWYEDTSIRGVWWRQRGLCLVAGGGKSSRLIGSLTRESRTGGGEGGREQDLALVGSGIGGLGCIPVFCILYLIWRWFCDLWTVWNDGNTIQLKMVCQTPYPLWSSHHVTTKGGMQDICIQSNLRR